MLSGKLPVVSLRHAAALALVGCLLVPANSSAADSKLSTYRNKEYGFSFQYPADWRLKEGDPVKLDWGYMGPVQSALPNGTMVVAVLPEPQDLPDPNFAGLFLSASVDGASTEADCLRYAPAPDDYEHAYEHVEAGRHPRVKIGRYMFVHADDDDGGLCHERSADYYRVFRNQVCYEFEIGEVTSCQTTSDAMRENAAVLQQLKRALATVTIRDTKLAPSEPKQTTAPLSARESGKVPSNYAPAMSN